MSLHHVIPIVSLICFYSCLIALIFKNLEKFSLIYFVSHIIYYVKQKFYKFELLGKLVFDFNVISKAIKGPKLESPCVSTRSLLAVQVLLKLLCMPNLSF